MEENNIKKSFTFVGYMENEFLIVDLEKEDSENSNSLKGEILKDIQIKKEKINILTFTNRSLPSLEEAEFS